MAALVGSVYVSRNVQDSVSSSGVGMADSARIEPAAEPEAGPTRGPLALLFKLAWPTALARAGILLMALADIVMVGRYDAQELAYASLGFSLFVPLLVTGIGLLMGVMILSAQAFGADDHQEAGAVWRRGMPWALTLGAGAAVLCLFGETWLTLIGHEPQLAKGGGQVAHMLSVGVAAQLLYVVCVFHLEATRRPLPGMIAMVVANVLNIALNWVFIYGNLGAPELGAVGSAMTTSIVRVFLLVTLLIVVLRLENRQRYRIGLDWANCGFWGPGGWRAGARMRRLGGAAGASIFFETTAYAAVLQFAGYLGAGVLGAYAIAHNMEATIFMVALGLSAATGVLVGNAAGAANPAGAAQAAWLGLRVVLGVMVGSALLIWAFSDWIAAGYTNDPTLAARAAPLLALIGVAIIFDGAQLVMGQVARALGDAWGAAKLYVIAFWGVLAPSAWLFGVYFEWGGQGLILGVTLGCATSFVMLWLRVRALLAEMSAPPGKSELTV
ncbi:MAG: MATE family efflux transporter [Pseudomonadota bacterium]